VSFNWFHAAHYTASLSRPISHLPIVFHNKQTYRHTDT